MKSELLLAIFMVLGSSYSQNIPYLFGCTCGKENVEPRIFGGTMVSESKYPWVARIWALWMA
ncbi:hypothetical protein B4U79_19196, partial [Dinothrombium tinctorium]